MGREWPLVAFTVLGQAAVGIYVCAGTPLFLGAGSAGAEGRGRLTFIFAVLGLTAAASTLSLFHLHHPARAFRVLTNLGQSWLSREILFEIGFIGITALLGVCEGRRVGSEAFLKALFVLGGLAGVLFLFSMSRLYMLAAVPAWNRAWTPLSFLLTSLSLGALTAASIGGRWSGKPHPGGPLVALAFVFVSIEFAASLLATPVFGLIGHMPSPSLRPRAPARHWIHRFRLFVLAMGLGLLLVVVTTQQGSAGHSLGPNGFLAMALALVLVGQISDRFLFYGLLVPPGR